MGMYTGLRASVVVKPEWREAIALLHRKDRPDARKFDSGYAWERVHEHFPGLPGLVEWVKVGRRDFIPFGGLAYMPEDFSDAEDGQSFSKFNGETGEWRFCCSLKNYEGEIKTFVETLLARIVERVEYCESLYEESQWGPEGEVDWRNWTTKWLTD